MKTLTICMMALVLSITCRTKASAATVPHNVPEHVSYTSLGDPKPDTKKGKSKKAQDDKLKRTKKPGELNKNKRADKAPVYKPTTIIVV